MKNIMKALKDPYIQKVIVAMSIQAIGTVMLSNVCTARGVQIGGNSVIENAERMIPGFTEQLQKFVSAERYGWKS